MIDETVSIYTGSVVLAEALAGRLEEKNIIPIIRKDQQDGKMFGSGSNYADQVRVFIRHDELVVAQPIIDIFLLEIQED